MIPRTIRSNLAGLRRRERLLALVWGGARWLAVVVGLLLVGALIDWFIDRDRDTPWAVRYAVFGVQAAVAIVTAYWFVLRPQLRRLGDSELALWVEDRAPHLGHRLISAVQLNRPGADTGGMSPELIGVVTGEAERATAGMTFAGIADHGRVRRAAAVLLPVLAVAAVPLVLWPALSVALLERQLLADVEVPHRVQLANLTPEVWPAGEKVKLVYRVTADDIGDDWAGEVVVAPDGQPRDRFPLTFLERDGDGRALFGVELPPASADFVHSARLGDGRSHRPSAVRFVPRPVIERQDAFVLLPASCGVRPDGTRYEQPQGRGDVVGIPGSAVRVSVGVQKPIKTATLEVLGPERFDPARPDDDQGPEKVLRTIAMTIAPSGQDAEATFDLTPGAAAYRVVVADEYRFANVPPPRRTLRLVPEEPPQVTLLRDSFGPDADTDLEGIPVPLGKSVRIPYVAHGPYGLGRARILYRVLKKRDSSADVADDGPWVALPAPEVAGTDKLGPFDPKRGVFQNMTYVDRVPFHAVPSPNPMAVLGRTLGGGRYFLETTGLIDPAGKTAKVKVGDQVEYCVEVVSRSGEQAAKSESRVTTIVSPDDLRAWTRAVLREEEQIRRLDAEQRGVFDQGRE
jgi:hypothetical protein